MRTLEKPSRSSASRTLRTSCGLTPRGSKRPICGDSERSTIVVDVSSRTPQSCGPSARATATAVPTQSLSKSTSTITSISRAERLDEAARREHGVAAVGRDQPVRHRAHAAPAPPRGLRVGRDADRARDVRGVAVAGLHAVMVVARREVEDRLAARPRARPRARCARSACGARACPGRRVSRWQKSAVVALDRHHGLPRLDLVAVVEGVHDELVPAGLPARRRRRRARCTRAARRSPRPCRRARTGGAGRPASARAGGGASRSSTCFVKTKYASE